MTALKIIKIGGNVLDNAQNLKAFLADFARISAPKILVHGGGKLANKLAERLGIEPNMLNGRRITDAETLQVVTMVYAGWINKDIVTQLQSMKVNALGLSGADANLIVAQKRPVTSVDYGFVGDLNPQKVQVNTLVQFLKMDLCPVFCAITHSEEAQLLNTNADTIAATLAVALSKSFTVDLIYCFEKNGVLMDVADETSVIPAIDPAQYTQLKAAQVIFEGMLPKIDNAFDAIQNGVHAVYIGSAKEVQAIALGNAGTKIHENK